MSDTMSLSNCEWKDTEIGKLPIDAELVELETCLDLIIDHRGKTPIKLGGDWVDSGIRAISAKNVHNGKLTNQDDIRYVTIEMYKKWMKEDLKEGDCLLASEGATLGEYLYWDFDFPVVLSQRLFCIRTNPKKLDPKYFYAFVTSNYFQNQIHGKASGTSVFGLRQTEVRSMLVSLIPLERQKVIGEIIYCLNKKIDLLHRQNATLEKIAETLFRQWFVEEAKEEWEEKTLEDVLIFVVDNRGKTAPTSESGIPLIATNCIKNCNIFPVYEKVRYISEIVYNNWFRAHPKPGDIIFVNKGTPGCVNLVPDPIDFCIAQDMIALRVNKNLISNFYLFIYLRLETTQADILNSSVGTTIPHLKKTDLLKYMLTIPPIQLMNKFNLTIEPLFSKMNKNQTQIRTITALRDTLLPKLMSGEVKVEMN